MSNSGRKVKARRAPLSVRLTAAEHAALAARAGDLPLSTYVKHVVFAADAPVFRRGPRTVSVDRELVARLLAALGASRMAANLAQIAKHANLGNLFFDEDTKADIRRACDDVRAMRALLMRALGKDALEGSGREPLSSAFELVAAPLEPAP